MIKHGMAAAYDAKLTLIFTAILAGERGVQRLAPPAAAAPEAMGG